MSEKEEAMPRPKKGQDWWSSLSSKQKEDVVRPLIEAGKTNEGTREELGLKTPNQIAGVRDRINKKNPDYKPKRSQASPVAVEPKSQHAERKTGSARITPRRPFGAIWTPSKPKQPTAEIKKLIDAKAEKTIRPEPRGLGSASPQPDDELTLGLIRTIESMYRS